MALCRVARWQEITACSTMHLNCAWLLLCCTRVGAQDVRSLFHQAWRPFLLHGCARCSWFPSVHFLNDPPPSPKATMLPLLLLPLLRQAPIPRFEWPVGEATPMAVVGSTPATSRGGGAGMAGSSQLGAGSCAEWGRSAGGEGGREGNSGSIPGAGGAGGMDPGSASSGMGHMGHTAAGSRGVGVSPDSTSSHGGGSRRGVSEGLGELGTRKWLQCWTCTRV